MKSSQNKMIVESKSLQSLPCGKKQQKIMNQNVLKIH